MEGSEKRGGERRLRPTPYLSRYTLIGGRRRGGRRRGEARDTFVDQFSQSLFLAGCLVLMLNMLDAFFTMYLLGLGGEEANPIAGFLLAIGPWAFILAKTLGIGLCTVVLVMIKNFRGAKLGLSMVLLIYALLLAWHLYLCESLQTL